MQEISEYKSVEIVLPHAHLATNDLTEHVEKIDEMMMGHDTHMALPLLKAL